jgi:hypothetical protein
MKGDSWDDRMEDPATVANRQAIITGNEKAVERRKTALGRAPGATVAQNAPTGANGAEGRSAGNNTARTVRDAVRVTVAGDAATAQVFRSVALAFITHALPFHAHIKFRLKVKAERKAVYEHETVPYLFEIVE